jgi:hypothetical protein
VSSVKKDTVEKPGEIAKKSARAKVNARLSGAGLGSKEDRSDTFRRGKERG